MKNNCPVGVFDSGMGGLTAVKELAKLLPYEDIIYLGDTARVPYGTRSEETIIKYAAQDIEFLRSHNVKMIVAACGTVSSVAKKSIDSLDIPATGVILPAVKAACLATKNKKIGVIGTSATIKSKSYETLIHTLMPDADVYSVACPMFVPLVENGYIGRGCKPTELIACEYLQPLKDKGIDTLILGCTHYPLIWDIIADVMGDDVTLISSGQEAGKYAKELLEKNNLLSDRKEKGKISLYCTDSAKLFLDNAKHFLDGMDGYTVDSVALE